MVQHRSPHSCTLAHSSCRDVFIVAMGCSLTAGIDLTGDATYSAQLPLSGACRERLLSFMLGSVPLFFSLRRSSLALLWARRDSSIASYCRLTCQEYPRHSPRGWIVPSFPLCQDGPGWNSAWGTSDRPWRPPFCLPWEMGDRALPGSTRWLDVRCRLFSDGNPVWCTTRLISFRASSLTPLISHGSRRSLRQEHPY